MSGQTRLPFVVLLLGDALAILVVTLIGFASHGLSLATPRWLTTYVPMLLSWFLLAPWLGLFVLEASRRPAHAWRAALAAAFAAPMAALLRSLWLGNTVVPVFALVLIGTSALGMFLWRLAWSLLYRRVGSNG